MGPFSGVGRPNRGQLSLYVVGSGYGESAVIVLPRGAVVVVDTCVEGRTHLTLDLLRVLEVERIDLLLVTHSDLDHLRGVPELLAAMQVIEVWRFPGGADVRTLAAKWLRDRPTDRRLRELAEAMRSLDGLAATNRCAEACADLRPWPDSPRAPVHVTCLAPSQYDQLRSHAALDRMVRMNGRLPQLGQEVSRFLGKSSRSVGVPPNVLSLAATVEWRAADLRLVLGGDVERGDGTAHSGWRGILATLDRRGSRDLVRQASAVKVAHHGSRGAQESEAWDEHVRSRAEQTHGSVVLPDIEVLRELHGRGVRLAICDARSVMTRARSARWNLDGSIAEVCAGPLIALAWSANGACTAVRGKRAAIYVTD